MRWLPYVFACPFFLLIALAGPDEVPPQDSVFTLERALRIAEENNLRCVLHQAAERLLQQRSWPGNLRELQHTLERACILTDGESINVEDISYVSQVSENPECRTEEDLKTRMLRCESQLIREALEKHQWRIVETAASLGISRKSLWEKMRKHGHQEPVR